MTDDEIRELVFAGWKQVSRKYCMIARLPDGMTGKQALAQHDKELADRLPQSDAEGFYMRVHAERDGLVKTLGPSAFIRFRKMGGESAR